MIQLQTPGLEVLEPYDERRIYCAGRILVYRPDGRHVRARCGEARIDLAHLGGPDFTGTEITALVRNVPRDGRDHIVVCPTCGNKITVMKT